LAGGVATAVIGWLRIIAGVKSAKNSSEVIMEEDNGIEPLQTFKYFRLHLPSQHVGIAELKAHSENDFLNKLRHYNRSAVPGIHGQWFYGPVHEHTPLGKVTIKD